MLRHVALVRKGISEELNASIIRVTRIGKLGTLAVTSKRVLLVGETHKAVPGTLLLLQGTVDALEPVMVSLRHMTYHRLSSTFSRKQLCPSSNNFNIIFAFKYPCWKFIVLCSQDDFHMKGCC
jgi:hypothetical protein